MAVETLTLDQLPAWANRAAAKLASIDFIPCWKRVKVALVAATQLNFVGSHDPDGVPWLPFARTPGPRRGGPAAKLLRDTGLLMASVTAGGGGHTEEMTATMFRFGTNVHYAGYHQYGTSRIPARQFLGLGAALLAEIDLIVGEFVAEKLAGGKA